MPLVYSNQDAEAKYARDLYIPELQLLVDEGEPVRVGERTTLELLNYRSVVTEPWHHCILLPSRRWNPWLALSEGLWILAGKNDVATLANYNSNIAQFSDDGIVLYGAYGARIFEQIDDLVGRLQRDPNDRRAVLAIWDKADLTAQTKDPPCNDMVMFKLRQGKLHMTVMNRSNDIHWGLFAVNLPTFSMLQVYLAARLGCGIGTQTHFSNSLHVYTDWAEPKRITERMLYKEPEDKPRYPDHHVAFVGLDVMNHTEFAYQCRAALDGVAVSGRKPKFLEFARNFLFCYKNREIPTWIETMYPEYADWIMAGKIFLEKTSLVKSA